MDTIISFVIQIGQVWQGERFPCCVMLINTCWLFSFSEADVNAKDADGNTALHLSQLKKPTMVNNYL